MTRTQLEREQDLVLTAQLYSKGWSYADIADIITEKRAYSISFVTVGNDVKELLKRWQERQQNFIDSHVAAALMKLEVMEQEAWRAYERSKRPKNAVKEKRTALITADSRTANKQPLDGNELDKLFELETTKLDANKPIKMPEIDLTDLTNVAAYQVEQQIAAEQRDGCPKWFKLILEIQDRRLELVQYVESKAAVSKGTKVVVKAPEPVSKALFMPPSED